MQQANISINYMLIPTIAISHVRVKVQVLMLQVLVLEFHLWLSQLEHMRNMRLIYSAVNIRSCFTLASMVNFPLASKTLVSQVEWPICVICVPQRSAYCASYVKFCPAPLCISRPKVDALRHLAVRAFLSLSVIHDVWRQLLLQIQTRPLV